MFAAHVHSCLINVFDPGNHFFVCAIVVFCVRLFRSACVYVLDLHLSWAFKSIIFLLFIKELLGNIRVFQLVQHLICWTLKRIIFLLLIKGLLGNIHVVLLILHLIWTFKSIIYLLLIKGLLGNISVVLLILHLIWTLKSGVRVRNKMFAFSQ